MAKKQSKNKSKRKLAPGKLRPRMPKYLSDSFQELKKVTWPGRKEAWALTLAVFIYSFVFLVFILLADELFKKIAERIFL